MRKTRYFFNKSRVIKITNDIPKSDSIFALLTVMLAIFGTAMVLSAGSAYASFRYNDSSYFIKKQAVWLILGILVMLISSRIHTSFYKKATPVLYGITLALLILVLVIGFAGNGAKRWISIGPITIQPSEIAKLTMLMMLSRYFSDNENFTSERRSNKVIFIYATLIPFAIIIIPTVLVMLQHHLSCIVILGTIGIALMVISGISLKYISAFMSAGALGVLYIALFTDYTKNRITVWRNPEAYKLTGGWQTLQGLMAIGRGGIWGVGFGNSTMKHCYVSEPANDMIFAILCEELGLVGAGITILLFALLINRGIRIALHANSAYERLLGLGICIKLAVQVLLNIGVVTNTVPNTGISLPFFSYGGSSLIMLFFEMGIMLSISRYAKIEK